MYKIGYTFDDSIERYKTRLDVKDYTQIEVFDFEENFSLEAKFTKV